MRLRALEFFSGIGAFAQAAPAHNIEVVAAYDQSEWANLAYEKNYGLKPVSRNLDNISLQSLPEADIWWLSPPCTPYTRRGLQRDLDDERARSFLHLITCMVERKPPQIIIENVEAFLHSKMHGLLNQALLTAGYYCSICHLNPKMFGVPMLRPRLFIIATLEPHILSTPPVAPHQSLASIISGKAESIYDLFLNDEVADKYEKVLNVVDSDALSNPDTTLICFTSGYYQCRKASGTLLRTQGGRLRYFSPTEILALLGFDASYSLPDHFSLPICYRLLGNSVDVRAISYLLKSLVEVSDK